MTRFAALALVALTTACDPMMMEDFDEDDAEDVDENLWTRELAVGDFELSIVHVYTALDGTCTTTRTHEATGNGERAVGSLTVGIPDAEGNLVIGTISLGGYLAVAEDNAPDDCWGSDSAWEMDGTAGGIVTLRAPRSGDPMTLTVDDAAQTIEEVVFDETIFAADALHDDGAAETLELKATKTLANDGESGRAVEITVDLVVDIVSEDPSAD